jgi:glyoxylase I family protein
LTVIEAMFHCNVNCTDLERSVAFYEMLGFRVVVDFRDGMSSAAMAKAFNMPQAQLRGVHLALGDDAQAMRIDLVEFQEPKTTGTPYSCLHHAGVVRICLRTQNIHQGYEYLQGKGVNFLSAPQTLPGTDVTIVCFTDPDGTMLELLEGSF